MSRVSSVKKSLRQPHLAPAALEVPSPRLARDSAGKIAVGAKLKRVRVERGMTLEEVGERAGVARSTLSKIENGLTSPTIAMLQKIVDALSISYVELFDETRERERVFGRRSINLAAAGKKFDIGPYTLDLMAADIATKKMLPFKARIRARDISEFEGWMKHEGEEFLFVLSGQVKIYTELYTAETLNPGDSMYWDSTMGHACISTSVEDAEVLWITTGHSAEILASSSRRNENDK